MKIKKRDEIGVIYFPGTGIPFDYYAYTENNKVVLDIEANTFNSNVLEALEISGEDHQIFKTWGKLHEYLSQFEGWKIREEPYL